MAIEWMVNNHGVNQVGLLTLSFGVPDSGRGSQAPRELRELAKDLDFVQERWRSFRSNVTAERCDDWICILKPHKDGVWHIHVVVATKKGIRTDTDVDTLSNYKLPYCMRRGKHLHNEALAAEWKRLRETACKCRFGRVELLPIKKTKEAFARYRGKFGHYKFRPGASSDFDLFAGRLCRFIFRIDGDRHHSDHSSTGVRKLANSTSSNSASSLWPVRPSTAIQGSPLIILVPIAIAASPK